MEVQREARDWVVHTRRGRQSRGHDDWLDKAFVVWDGAAADAYVVWGGMAAEACVVWDGAAADAYVVWGGMAAEAYRLG
eukprot:366064-Chlamydomonas_euryale.AAC.13